MDESTQYDKDGEIRRKILGVAEVRLGTASDLSEIIAVVRSMARSVCSADGVTFVLRDGNFCHYVDEDAIGPLWKGQKFPANTCISGWAMINAQTAWIDDIFVDDRIPHDVYRKTFVKSLVMTPVGRNTPVAAIGAYWSERHRITPHDIHAIEALAAAVARAMRRVEAA